MTLRQAQGERKWAVGPALDEVRAGATPGGLRLKVAQALYARRPFVLGTSATFNGVAAARSFEWESAPWYYQAEMLELADAAVAVFIEIAPGSLA